MRALLLALLLYADRYVSFNTLAEHLWFEPPLSAQANLRTHATALRRVLAQIAPGQQDRLHTRRGGVGGTGAYRLEARAEEIDSAAFTELAYRGQRELMTSQPAAAVDTLRQALRLWRGDVTEDVPQTLPLSSWAMSMRERRLTVIDDLAQARLAVGDHVGLAAMLRRHSSANPMRERAAENLMRALDATSDRPGAIAAFQEYRVRLIAELGIEPSPRLQKLHLSLLRGEPIGHL
ncbi:AfsR/SARP family transcriptional regulator [Micromonospora sp. DT233]|uniref:AfsR/SARP family transcriptional regulator n=1 Tax=Micromonospora sp. DT233 TaxID=3393432 RepID=UPI003CF63F72